MGTLARTYNNMYSLQQSQGVLAKSIINDKGSLITAIPTNHPLMLDRNYTDVISKNHGKNPAALRTLIGDRKKIESAGPSYVEVNATPQMMQAQLTAAMQNKNSEMGQYVAQIYQELSKVNNDKLDRILLAQGQRPAPGMHNPIDPQAELAQLDLSQPIKRPYQLTPDMVAAQQMTLPNPADKYMQFGGMETIHENAVPGWYSVDPNSNKRARMGGLNNGAQVWVGDRIENQIRHTGINPMFVKPNQPYTQLKPEQSTGSNAPENPYGSYGPNPSPY